MRPSPCDGAETTPLGAEVSWMSPFLCPETTPLGAEVSWMSPFLCRPDPHTRFRFQEWDFDAYEKISASRSFPIKLLSNSEFLPKNLRSIQNPCYLISRGKLDTDRQVWTENIGF